MGTDFTRIIKISPAKGRKGEATGISAARLLMGVVRDGKAITVTYSTGWHADCSDRLRCLSEAYHQPTPEYEGQWRQDWCEWLDGPCYSDGPSLWDVEDEWEAAMLAGGTKSVWAKLEARWHETFEEA